MAIIWNETQPAGDTNKFWYCCSISGDKMIAGAYNGRLYYYNGSSWSETQPAGDTNQNWYSCSISGDKMIAGVNNGRLYTGSSPRTINNFFLLF